MKPDICYNSPVKFISLTAISIDTDLIYKIVDIRLCIVTNWFLANLKSVTTIIITLMFYLFPASAQIPIEVGTNDQQISNMGTVVSNRQLYQSFNPDIAYNSAEDKFLVVYSAEDSIAGSEQGRGEFDIYGIMLDGDSNPIGSHFRISSHQDDGDSSFDGLTPSVVYNTTENEFMVVWSGSKSPTLSPVEFEIFGVRVDSVGQLIGSEVRISNLVPGGTFMKARVPDIAFNSLDNEYLVVWQQEGILPMTFPDEFEIYGQRLSSQAVEIGGDFRISDAGTDGSDEWEANAPKVVFNPVAMEYMVVWQAELDNNDCEQEIFGQRLNRLAQEVGTNDFRISQAGPDGNCDVEIATPDIAVNVTDNEYLVVWQGQDTIVGTGLFIFNAHEIYGQRLDASGNEIGANDFRISDVGGVGDVVAQIPNDDFRAAEPTVLFANNHYLVAFEADDDVAPQVNNDLEILVQLLDKNGNQVGNNDMRISDIGTDGSTSFPAGAPAIGYSPLKNQFIVVFDADDNTPPQVDNEVEINLQRLGFSTGGSPNNDCSQTHITVTTALINSSGDNIFKATQSISSDAVLPNTFSNYLFVAPNEIRIDPEFTVPLGIELVVNSTVCVP